MPAIDIQNVSQNVPTLATDKEPLVQVTETTPIVATPTPADWMTQMLPLIGTRTLHNICLPRSHDSGMSMPINPMRLGSQSTVQTQSFDIGRQLELGVRRFDLRACLREGDFVCGHVQYINGSMVPGAAQWFLDQIGVDFVDEYSGGTGQRLEDMVNQLNDFTSKHRELVILEISHCFNFDRSQKGNEWGCAFNEAEYLQLFHLQLANVKNRFLFKSGQQDVLSIALKDLISSSSAVLLAVPNEFPISKLPNDQAAGLIFQSQLDSLRELTDTTHTQTTNEAICAFVSDKLGETMAKMLAAAIGGDSPWLQQGLFSIIQVAEKIKTTILPSRLATITKANFMNTVSLDNVDDAMLCDAVQRVNLM